MRGRDRSIVAGILAVALVLGLVLVDRALDRAWAARTEKLQAAQTAANWAAASGSGEADAANSAAGDTGASSAGDTSPSASSSGAASGAAGAASSGEAQGSSDVGSDSAAGQPGGAAQSGGTAGAVVSVSAPLAEAAPLGAGEFTVDALVSWMCSESGGALAAQTATAAEQALAAGTGTGDDPQRRAFARTQWSANQEARSSALAEEGTSLALHYLRCRELLALEEENRSFYEKLLESVQNAAAADDKTDAGRTIRIQVDAASVTSALEKADVAVDAAKAELQSAMQAINSAVGNPAAAQVAVTGEVSRDAMPDTDAKSAVALALASRNEIKNADYAAARAKQTLKSLRYQYSTTAPEYLKQQAAAEQATADVSKARTTVESDVRDRCARLAVSARQLDLAQKELDAAGTSVSEIGYTPIASGTEWSSNADSLTAQWAEILGLRRQLIAGTVQLNLDILSFRHAIGAGTVSAEI